MKFVYEDMPDVICDNHDIVEVDDSIKKYKFFRDLAIFDMISYDCEKGVIWNNITDSSLGYINSTGYFTFGWKYKGKTLHILNHVFIWMMKFWTPKGLMLNHKDGNKQNNSIYNLELVTNQENVIHAFKHGLIDMNKLKEKGKRIRNYHNTNFSQYCKLTPKEAAIAKCLREKYNWSFRAIGGLFKMNKNNIADICRGISYRALNVSDINVTEDDVFNYLSEKDYDGPIMFNKQRVK